MRVAKGQRQPDGTYLYTCGTCGGKASADPSVECAWCYGGDVKRIAAELKLARGARYYALLKAFLAVNGKAMVDEILRFKAERDGKFTPVELGYVSLKYNLNFKATWDWIHENGHIRYSYEDMGRASWKVKDVYAAARERYPELGKESDDASP